MKIFASFPSEPSQRNQGAPLLVMIGVLAIIAIFAVVLFRELLREKDHEVARQEAATLKQYNDALQNAIMRTGIIPDQTTWDATVATEMGENLQQVANNPRRQPRILLLNAGSWGQPNPPFPYTQGASPTGYQPMNARMMIVSSLGAPLPISGGVMALNNFSALWNCRDGDVPASWAAGGWTGRPQDVKVERIALEGLFVRLILMTAAAETYLGRYSMDGGTTTGAAAQPVGTVSPPPIYVLRGTTILLYSGASGSNIDVRQILTKDAAYKYENGIWKIIAAGAPMPGAVDLAGVARGFMTCTANTNAFHGVQQQELVLRSFIEFMRGYVTWATNGFPAGSKAAVEAQEVYMVEKCQQLFMTTAPRDGGGGSYNCFPINQGSCE